MIGKWAFYECYGLVSAELPEGLQAIGEGWFSHCYALKHLRIPSSVVRVEESAFT
jgi:hypothetical protein